MLCAYALAAALLWGALSPLAASPAAEFYEFETAEQERKFNQLTRELRCPKCQNQSIADSDAPLAMDMRQRVYQMIMEGQSQAEIIDFMKVRYGDFVHYRPPVNASTIVLWVGPALVIVLGVIVVLVQVRTQKDEESELSEEEAARLAEVLNSDRKE
ncbi:MAG: cytochrome c-type biogenesis protein CcmH [Idiomarina sp.]|nr:cytochrome c-type biogenesis protein CcmH [Idiomarina sp.]